MREELGWIDHVATLLDGMEIVFVGAAVLPAYLTPEAARDARETSDVDLVVEAVSLGSYAKIEAELRRRGLRQWITGREPVCRYHTHGEGDDDDVVIDVIPGSRRERGVFERLERLAAL